MNTSDCEHYLRQLGQELQQRGITGEILISGDVVVLLDIHQPKIRRDLDAYLAGNDNALSFPTTLEDYFMGHGSLLSEAAQYIANHESLPDTWLYEALRVHFQTLPVEKEWRDYPGLRIYIALPQQALAMRVTTADIHNEQHIEDIARLAEQLQLTTTRAVLSWVRKYITQELITSTMHESVKVALKRQRSKKRRKCEQTGH